MTESNAVPGFLPSTHGFHFANRFPSGPTVKLGPLDPRWVGIGDASSGLCGGMAWYVRETFAAAKPIPADAEPPANGSPLFQAIVRRQVLSLDWLRGPARFWLTAARGATQALAETRQTEWPAVRAVIDAGRLPMLGLVRHTGWNPFALSSDHQVLAFAYSTDGPTGSTTIRLYDPNWPDRDDVTLTIDAFGLRQNSGEPLFGFFSQG
jgi:hypothetical protein